VATSNQTSAEPMSTVSGVRKEASMATVSAETVEEAERAGVSSGVRLESVAILIV
jgi:hypothetical protein